MKVVPLCKNDNNNGSVPVHLKTRQSKVYTICPVSEK